MKTETPAARNDKSITELITAFLNEIGISCRPAPLPGTTFLPGVDIREGCILYDAEKMTYPGDLLHEAGHLAVLHPDHRALVNGPDNISGNVDPAAAEMAAIAWSWAAKEYLGIAPEVVFHSGGYKDGSDSLISCFSDFKGDGALVGVPILQLFGMTRHPQKTTEPDDYTFPRMRHWLRQS